MLFANKSPAKIHKKNNGKKKCNSECCWNYDTKYCVLIQIPYFFHNCFIGGWGWGWDLNHIWKVSLASATPILKAYVDAWLSLRWRHNGRDGVSNNQPHDCLLSRLFRRRSKKTPKLRVTGLCAEPVNSPHKWPVTRKMSAFDDVIMGKYVANGTDWQMFGKSLFCNQYIVSVYYPYGAFLSFSVLSIFQSDLLLFPRVFIRHVVTIY